MSRYVITRVVVVQLLAITLLAAQAAADVTGPHEKLTVNIPRITAPRIDGDLTDIGWTEASIKGGRAVVDLLFSWKHPPQKRLKRPAIVYLGYDNEALYVSMIHFDPDAESRPVPKSCWTDDGMTLHLMSTADKGPVQLKMNGACVAVNSLDGKKRKSGFAKVREHTEGITWRIEAAIPFDWLQLGTPETGDTWGISIALNLNRENVAGVWSMQTGQFKVKELSHAVFGE